MPRDAYIILGMAGFFFLVFVIAFLRANADDRKIDDAISQRKDVKGFGAFHIQSSSLRIGGWIFLMIAAALFIMGVVFLATQ
jgi:hypothetical protein